MSSASGWSFFCGWSVGQLSMLLFMSIARHTLGLPIGEPTNDPFVVTLGVVFMVVVTYAGLVEP